MQSVVLLRTHVFADRERTIMRELADCGIGPVAVAADESQAPLEVGPFDKVSVTRHSCEAVGLFCPRDFAWRNGDYPLYLARARFPQATHFWMVEPDVEHSFPSFRDFFDRFASRPEIDLLAAWLRLAEPGWYWRQTMSDRPGGIWRCLFATVRISAPAIDACLAARRGKTFSLRDRLNWPNDEVFVATQTVASGLTAADFNTPTGKVYAPEVFGYTPIDGASDFRHPQPGIYHPVLHGAAYQDRIARQLDAADVRWRRRLQRVLP